MEDFPKIQWQAPEYEERERTRDWFWALGVIVVTASIASIIFKDYFFAALIILGGAVLGMLATKKPEMVSYELNSKGIQIRSRLYPFENIHAFWVSNVDQFTLFLKTERIFLPIISIPIHPDDAEHISAIMLEKKVSVEEMHEHISGKILEVLGF